MRIDLSPQIRDDRLTVDRAGDALTINGEVFDFTPLPDGGALPQAAVACQWLASEVTRAGGVLHLTLILPHDETAPLETLFPAPIIDPPDGPVDLPPYGAEVSDEY